MDANRLRIRVLGRILVLGKSFLGSPPFVLAHINQLLGASRDYS